MDLQNQNEERENPYQAIEEILSLVKKDSILRHKKGSNFRFNIYLTERMQNKDVEVLELSERAKNALKRAGVRTIGDLVSRFRSSTELGRLRNCGSKSVNEIMVKLFCYQYFMLPEKERESYLLEVLKMNQN